MNLVPLAVLSLILQFLCFPLAPPSDIGASNSTLVRRFNFRRQQWLRVVKVWSMHGPAHCNEAIGEMHLHGRDTITACLFSLSVRDSALDQTAGNLTCILFRYDNYGNSNAEIERQDLDIASS